ncbi:hypothetical protein SAMN05444285_11457 [Draconibacterium orientale]|uniref:Uncharacterized protein n=1 Tax=Draconibacterium orientale TaxID=1168034 RepID=X5DJZ9_9BACT|nr:DUF6261 family protein [Draconibacterium orientale]AHW61484.1 hypothetical protein FH5T_02140 [Draconibacterium orientale]SET48910.1 hypothetical protein SAMN05444285_11457 [Draconibacterium orientale]
MKKILNLFLYKLRNGEYFQFMSDFKGLLVALTPAAIHSEAEFAEFDARLTKLDDELRVDQGSVLTEQLQSIDQARDNIWRAIDMRINATMLCGIYQEVEAAKLLRRLFDLYGDVRRVTYNEETAGLTNLIGDLTKPENTDIVTACQLDTWVNHLKQANIAFKAKQNERDTVLANKNSGNAKAVRLEIDPLYELLVERVNALVSLNMQTPEIENFIKELNQKIKTFENTIAIREGRRDSGEENETPAPNDE